MAVTKKKEISRFHWLWNKIRYGLVLMGVRNRLGRIGLEFLLYYWVLEGDGQIEEPKLRGDTEGYSLEYLGKDDIKALEVNKLGYTEHRMLDDLEKGKKCLALKHNGEVAAFMWFELNDFIFRNKIFRIRDNEAYLFTMHTMEEYRGRNLAPYLRYKSYEILRKEGRDTFYSISERFNASTIKFKNKLNARNLALIFSVELFGRYKRNFTIKKYEKR